MSVYDEKFVNSELSKPTSIFGLRLWVVIGIFVGVCIVLVLFLLSLCVTSRRRRTPPSSKHSQFPAAGELTPVVSKEIQEIVHESAPDHRPQQQSKSMSMMQQQEKIQIHMGKVEHRVVFTSSQASGESRGTTSGGETASLSGGGSSGCVAPEVSHLGWGRWYTLRELEVATNGLADENVIGEGGYGIVYKGVLGDGTLVAVKNLLNNRYCLLLSNL